METKIHGSYEKSNERRILENYILMKLIKEEVPLLTYDDLSRSINRDVRKDARSLLVSSVRTVEKENKIIIETVRGEGIKVSKAVTGYLEDKNRRIGRMAHRAVSTVTNAIAGGNVEDDEKVSVFSRLSILGAIHLFCRKSSIKKIEGKVEIKNGQLPAKETLELFK
jgi:hypothetical protein